MKELEDILGLHEEITLVYLVTHFSAVLTTQDGFRDVAKGEGETILEALQDLCNTVKERGLTADSIRKNKK